CVLSATRSADTSPLALHVALPISLPLMYRPMCRLRLWVYLSFMTSMIHASSSGRARSPVSICGTLKVLKTSIGVLAFPLRWNGRSEEHTSELQSRFDLVCRLLLEK